MAKSNPTRPGAPRDEKRVDDGSELPDADGPALKDPRSIAAMDNIGVDDQGDLLDENLDDGIGDRGNGRRDFSDDVRSDTIGGLPDRHQ
ncbi:MAG TPA: hypothetical protein VK000_03860 [Luteimonas sp.]|nr:hypothetical protein [Luteimonas sp.]